MDASTLKPVADVTTKGGDYRPSAGRMNGWITNNEVGSGPAPTPAPNSGRKLDTGMTQASQAVSNGQGSMYDGSPDNDSDELPMKSGY